MPCISLEVNRRFERISQSSRMKNKPKEIQHEVHSKLTNINFKQEKLYNYGTVHKSTSA